MKLIRSNPLWLLKPKLEGDNQKRALLYRQSLAKVSIELWGDAGVEAFYRLINMPFALTTKFWLSGGTTGRNARNKAKVYLMNELPSIRFFRSANRYKESYEELVSKYYQISNEFSLSIARRLSIKDLRKVLLAGIKYDLSSKDDATRSLANLFAWIVKTM